VRGVTVLVLDLTLATNAVDPTPDLVRGVTVLVLDLTLATNAVVDEPTP
jgi:hypothetical protein